MQRTPEQEAARKALMVELPPDWVQQKCRVHPDMPLVQSVQPGRLYCALCMRTYSPEVLDREESHAAADEPSEPPGPPLSGRL